MTSFVLFAHIYVPAIAVALGYKHRCVLLLNTGVACWGANGDGQLGIGTLADTSTPARVLLQTGLNDTYLYSTL